MKSPLTLAASLLTLAALSAPAAATPAPRITSIGAPRTQSGPRRVIEDAWKVDCATLHDTGTCLATVTSRSHGAGVVVIDAPEALDGDSALKLDGAPQWPTQTDDGTGFWSIRLTLGEGEHVLVVRWRLHLDNDRRMGWVVPADEARHLVFHEGQVAGDRTLVVAPTPIEARVNGYTFDLTVVRDPAFRWQESPVPGDPPWSYDGATAHLRTTPRPLPGTTTDASPVRLVVFKEEPALLHFGGPMLGLGAGLEGAGSFRVRLEYEVALDDWILPGLALDADTTHGWELTPRLEVSTPIIIILPSISAGIGLPIRLQPDPDVGVRFLVGVAFGPVGVSGSFDLFPRPGGVELESAVLLRLSL